MADRRANQSLQDLVAGTTSRPRQASYTDPQYGLDGDSAWYGRGIARGLAFTQETAAEALDLGSDYSGGLFSYFARPAERALRERAAALRQWAQTPEDASGLERFGEGATEVAATLPAYIAATQTGGLIAGMGAMGYLRGRPEGRGMEEAAKEATLGVVMRGTEPLTRLPRFGINAITGAKLFEPEDGYQEPVDYIVPAAIGAGAALPKAVPRARGGSGRRSVEGEQPGSVESPSPPATSKIIDEADARRLDDIAAQQNISPEEAAVSRIGELQEAANAGDVAAQSEIGRIKKTLELMEVGKRDPRLEHRGERSVFVQRQMDELGASEVDATRAWRDEVRSRIDQAPAEVGLEAATAAAQEARGAADRVRSMKPRELYEAGLLGPQEATRPSARELGNRKRRLVRATEKKASRLEKLEETEERLAVVQQRVVQEDPIFQEPLGVAREPVLYPDLADLSDDAFDASYNEANERVLRIERAFDDAPELADTDPAFRREMAQAQDDFTAHELEQWRRGLDEANPAASPEDLARDMRGLNLQISEDKVKATMIAAEMSRRSPEAQRRFNVAMGDYAKQSPDHAEILQYQLEDFSRVMDEAGTRGLPGGGAAKVADDVWTTSDGYKFYRQPDGSFTDSPNPADADLTFGSLDEFAENGIEISRAKADDVWTTSDGYSFYRQPDGSFTDAPNPADADLTVGSLDEFAENGIEISRQTSPSTGARDTVGSDPPIKEVPLVERNPATLTRGEEATLQGVDESVISALERAPRPGPKRVDADGKALPDRSYGGPMARGAPRASDEEIRMLQYAGFMDAEGNLTPKGEESLAGRRKRFDDNRQRLAAGDPVPAQVILEWPDQMERAARVSRTAATQQGNRRPGTDPADDLTVDDLKLADDDTLRRRRTLDEARGREFLETAEEATTPRLAADKELALQDAAVELAETAGWDMLPTSVRPLYEQVMDLVSSDRIPITAMADILERHGLNLGDLSHAYGVTVKEAAQTLNRQRQMGARVARAYGVRRIEDIEKVVEVTKPRRELIKERLNDPNLSQAEKDALELQLSTGYLTRQEIATLKAMGVDRDIVQGMGLWRRLENVRRGMMVTQVSTVQRNLQTAFGNITMSMMQEANERAIRAVVKGTAAVTGNKSLKMYGDSIHPVRGFENFVNFFHELGARSAKWNGWNTEGSAMVTRILKQFPAESDMLTSSFNADITAIRGARMRREGLTEVAHRAVDGMEATSNLLNTFNRFQEHVFRRATFRAELGRQLEINPVSYAGKKYNSIEALEAEDLLGKIPQAQVRKAVEKSLEMTWSKNFDRGGAVAPIIDLINRVPVLSWFAPFPRFVANAIQWQLEHSPLGILRYASPNQREALLAGDVSGAAKAMAGTTLFFSALDLAKSEYATGDWYLYKNPETGELFDIRPYAPFAAYAFAAYVWTRSIEPQLSKLMGETVNVASQAMSGPTGLAYNALQETFGDGGFDQIEGRPGEPIRINRMDVPAIIQGIGAGNMRSGLGLYALDKVFNEYLTAKVIPDYVDAEGNVVSGDALPPGVVGSGMSRGGTAGEFLGGVAGNLVMSYATTLNEVWDGYKEFKKWQGDLEATQIGSSTAVTTKVNPKTGQEEIFPYEGFVDNLTSSFAATVKSKIPILDSPPVFIPTQEDPVRTYAPGVKALTGLVMKQPHNAAQELASEYDLSQSDILPSTGNPVFDDLTKKHMGSLIERDVIAWVKDLGDEYPLSKARAEYFEDLGYYQKVIYLKDRFKFAANEARYRAGKEAPMLYDMVARSRRDPRVVGAEREQIEKMGLGQ